MKYQPTIPHLLNIERIGYLTSMVGGIGVGFGLQSYFEQHQPPIIEDAISVIFLLGGAVMAYKSHQKRLELEQKELEQKLTPPPYLYIPPPHSLDYLVQDKKNNI